LPAPQIRGCSEKNTIAEKFEAMSRRGIMNSCMKDFWDIRLLFRQFDFDGPTPAAAITETFTVRHTVVPSDPAAFTEAFIGDEAKQSHRSWRQKPLKPASSN